MCGILVSAKHNSSSDDAFGEIWEELTIRNAQRGMTSCPHVDVASQLNIFRRPRRKCLYYPINGKRMGYPTLRQRTATSRRRKCSPAACLPDHRRRFVLERRSTFDFAIIIFTRPRSLFAQYNSDFRRHGRKSPTIASEDERLIQGQITSFSKENDGVNSTVMGLILYL